MKKQDSDSVFLKLYEYFLVKKFLLTALIIVVVALGLIPAIDSMLFRRIVDAAEAGTLVKDYYFVIIYAGYWEICNLLWRLIDYIYLRSIPVIRQYIISEIFSHIIIQPPIYFKENPSGRISNRAIEAANSVEQIFSIFTFYILMTCSTIISSLVVIFCVSKYLGIIFLIWVTIFISLFVILGQRARQYSSDAARSESNVSGSIIDSINNIISVRIFCRYDYEKSNIARKLDDMKGYDRKKQWYNLKMKYFAGISCSIMFMTMVLCMIYMYKNAKISLGDLCLTLSLAQALMQDVWNSLPRLNDLFDEIGNFQQSCSLFKCYKQHSKNNKIIINSPSIEFKNITFGHDNKKEFLFSDLSVHIPAKQKIALVGFSGSGKTTLTQLLARVHDVNSGKIYIDNIDTYDVEISSLRENICFVPQEPILFNRTIYENIVYARPEATEQEVIDAAKKAYIHQHICSLKDGYQTICGELGSNLSGGQKQRIAIARAMLKNSPILVWDEATSALDAITAKHISESLEILMEEKTVIIIAHKLSAIKNVDRILVFDNGKIVEDGDHNFLFKEGTLYHKLWNMQVI